MAKLMPQHIERHLAGLRAMTSHAERLYRQGILTADELEHARTYALEQRMGPLSDTETYIKARELGDFDKFEQIMNDPRSGTAAQREMVARKVAAHKIGQDAVNYQPQSQEEQNAVMKAAREQMAKFVDMSDEDFDNDLAVYEKSAKITLRDEVRKPVEEPSWAKPVQRLSDDDASARDFRLRDENTFGTARYNKAYDGQGVKRDANGRIIAKTTLREEADPSEAQEVGMGRYARLHRRQGVRRPHRGRGGRYRA